MAKYHLYDWKARENVAVATELEICLIAALHSGGKYEVVIDEVDTVIDIEEDSVLNSYIPESMMHPGMTISTTYGWKYQIWLNGKEIWSGSFDVSIFQDAYDVAKYGNVQILLWPINADGSPLGFDF